MEIESLFGLPAHPLIVHAAVVLVPGAVLALLATGWRPSWRRQFAIPVLLIALAGAFAAILAAGTGEPLEDAVKDAARAAGSDARFGDHPEQGESARLWSVLFAVAVIAYTSVALSWPRKKLPAWAPLASYGLAGVIGIAATVMMLVAGHSGAKLVWEDVGSFAAGR